VNDALIEALKNRAGGEPGVSAAALLLDASQEAVRKRAHRKRTRAVLLGACVVVLVVAVTVAVRLDLDGSQRVTTGQSSQANLPNSAGDTKELRADDPVVQAVVRLLPPGAQLKDAHHFVGRSGENAANYFRIEASVDGVTYKVLLYRRFVEDELSQPTVVNGAKTWPGSTGPNNAYLYYLSDSGVGLHLAIDGAIGDNAGAELMDLAQRAVNDPVIGKIKGVATSADAPSGVGPEVPLSRTHNTDTDFLQRYAAYGGRPMTDPVIVQTPGRTPVIVDNPGAMTIAFAGPAGYQGSSNANPATSLTVTNAEGADPDADATWYVVWTQVPEGTAYVVFSYRAQLSWQRPIGGVSVFTTVGKGNVPAGDRPFARAYDENGVQIGEAHILG
jgi:hypothetical protein